MKLKPWLRYFIYMILILLLISLKEYYLAYSHKTFHFGILILFIEPITRFCIGLILGIEHLVSEKKKDGLWKINLTKLFIAGIPSLYFSFPYFFLYGHYFLHNIISYPLSLLSRFCSGYIEFFPLILGYIIITSFYKSDKSEKKA